MSTRRAQLSPDHVNALNLIEIEFHGHAKVIGAWKVYLRNLETKFDPKDNDEVFRARQKLFAKLLSEMTKAMDINIEQLDIFEGGYYPQYAVDLEAQQQAIRKLFTDISEGRRSLPIEVTAAPTQRNE